jgi:hypothetical protein
MVLVSGVFDWSRFGEGGDEDGMVSSDWVEWLWLAIPVVKLPLLLWMTEAGHCLDTSVQHQNVLASSLNWKENLG